MALAFSGYSPPRISIFETFASIQLAYGPHPAAAIAGSVFQIRTGALKITGQVISVRTVKSSARIEKKWVTLRCAHFGDLCCARAK